MHAYIALKKMQIVPQKKKICRYIISQSSYTWKKAIGNFCTPAYLTNVQISEGQTMYRGSEIMYMCMTYTK